eukprot:symbB.v1.2.007927.t1/scaffold495.1/size259991/11
MAEMAETPAEMVETVEVAEMAETPAEMVETVEVAEVAATPAEMVETVEVAEMAESPAEMADVESPPVKRVAWDDGQDAPEPKLSRTFSRSVSRASSSANLAAKKGVKFSWSFVREIVFWEVLFRQIPMAYIVTVPAFLCMFVVTRLIQPSRQFEAEIPPGNTTLSLYVSWIPFGRDEIHQTAYGHFEWYVIYEVVGKALQLAMATWVLARLMLGREKFWQQSWRWEALGFAFFVGVMAAVNVCGAVVGHSQISTECVPVPYPFIAPASSFPCFVIFSLKMKRILGDHQFATLAVAILSQVFVLSTEYIVFVRNASMWPDSDLVIFIYKYTLQPFLWTFVIFPVVRHTLRSLDLPMDQKPALVCIFCIMPYAASRSLLFTFKGRGTFAIAAVLDQLVSTGLTILVPQIDVCFWKMCGCWCRRCCCRRYREREDEINMLAMVLFQVFMSVEAGTALIFSLAGPVLFSERLIFQRFFEPCAEAVDVSRFVESFLISMALMLLEDLFLSVLWVKDDLPLSASFNLMFRGIASWVVLSLSYASIVFNVVTAAALLPELMDCQDFLDVCSCSKGHMFAENCGCCSVENMTASMGLLKTRSPVLSLDLGANFLFESSRADGAADVVVAVLMSPASSQSFMAAAWDLSSLGTTMPMPLWQITVPSLVVHFLGPNVLLSSPVGAQLLCVSTGQILESITLHSSQPPGHSCKCPLPSLWLTPRRTVGRNSLTPSCVVLAVGRKVLAVVDADEKCSSSAAVQRSAVFEFASEVAGDITALTGSSDVVAATSNSCIYVWSLVDRVLLAQLPAVSELDLENLSWSLCRAETLTGLQQTPWVSAILLLDELLVCCANLGHPGSDSAACTWMAYHVPSCARLPHPWHLAGPLEASPSARAAATAPVLLPGISVGRLIADPSLRPLLDKQGLRKGLERTMSGPDQLQDEVWQDREIKFDQMPQLLKLRKGEFQIDSINSVEDTKGNNGERGILIVTNLRLIWTSAKYARTNLSIGFNCVSSVNIRTVTSKLRGNSQALYVMTRFNSTRFEFIFTSLVKHSPRLFTTVQAVFKSYETTKLYRDLKLRGAIIRDKELIMLPNEQVYERINGIWNLSSDQGNLGTFIITNVRTVWFAVLAENFNAPWNEEICIDTIPADEEHQREAA